MPITVTVLYPNPSDLKFDMSYYLTTHMPLVASTWGSLGLTAWTVTKYLGTASGSDSPYSVVAVLYWKSKEAFEGAVKEKSEEVMGDIPKFTNVEPTLIVGEPQGEWSA